MSEVQGDGVLTCLSQPFHDSSKSMTDSRAAARGAELYTAAYHGNADRLAQLLQTDSFKRNIDWQHPQGGATPLYVACEFNHHTAVKLLLKLGAKPNLAREDGATPLYKACQDKNGHSVANLLIHYGADVNKPGSSGITPLWIAVHLGNAHMADILLKAGADPTKKVQGWSAFELSRQEGKSKELRDVMDTYVSIQKGPSEDEKRSMRLSTAAYNGNTQELRTILADVDDPCKLVNTRAPQQFDSPLHSAAQQGHAAAVKLLIQARAHLSLGEKSGQTPLAAACAAGHLEIAKILLAAGASMMDSTRDGTTPLAVACYQGHADIVELLLSYGSDADAPNTPLENNVWVSPLVMAAAQGHTHCLRLLLEEDPDLNATFEGRSALWWAEKRGNKSCASILRELQNKVESRRCGTLSASTATVEVQNAPTLKNMAESTGALKKNDASSADDSEQGCSDQKKESTSGELSNVESVVGNKMESVGGKPAESEAAESEPARGESVEIETARSKTADSKLESVVTDCRLAQSMYANDANSMESKPANVKPVESKPPETKCLKRSMAGEAVKSMDNKLDSKPIGCEPAEAQASKADRVENEHNRSNPVDRKLAENESTVERPAQSTNAVKSEVEEDETPRSITVEKNIEKGRDVHGGSANVEVMLGNAMASGNAKEVVAMTKPSETEIFDCRAPGLPEATNDMIDSNLSRGSEVPEKGGVEASVVRSFVVKRERESLMGKEHAQFFFFSVGAAIFAFVVMLVVRVGSEKAVP